MNDQLLLKQYAELKLQEKQIKGKLEALSHKVEGLLTRDLLKTEFGSFQLRQTTTYTYSDEVQRLVAETKAPKALEEAKIKSLTQSIVYSAPKE